MLLEGLKGDIETSCSLPLLRCSNLQNKLVDVRHIQRVEDLEKLPDLKTPSFFLSITYICLNSGSSTPILYSSPKQSLSKLLGLRKVSVVTRIKFWVKQTYVRGQTSALLYSIVTGSTDSETKSTNSCSLKLSEKLKIVIFRETVDLSEYGSKGKCRKRMRE